jgi:hypothetical protein
MDQELGRAFRRCGNCSHRRLQNAKQDLTTFVCWLMPAHLVALPAKAGIQISGFRVPVAENEPACDAGWELKSGQLPAATETQGNG